MDKQIILEKLSKLEIDIEECIVISGASLVVQNVVDRTSDIDLSCSREYYESIDWPTKIGAFGATIKYKEVFEISDNLYYPNDVVFFEGIRFLKLEKCLKIKKELNRPKDQSVIKKLENLINDKYYKI